MRFSAKWLFAVTALVMAACGSEPDEGGETYLIYDRDNQAGEYRLFERNIETLEKIAVGNGERANLHAGGQIRITESDPQTKEEIANTMAIEGAKPPAIDYKVRSDGTVVPLDFHSTIMLTLYHHIEKAEGYFVGLGVDRSLIGKIPIYYYPKFQILLPLNLLSDNAAYAFTLDAFLIPPTLLLEEVPLAANRGVIVHEFSHLIFNRLVHENERAPEYLIQPWPDEATNRLRSLDEGVADIFAALQTEDPNFISTSISNELFDIDRDLSKERHYDQDLYDEVRATGKNQYNPYELGSVVASTVWAIRSELDDDALAKAVLDTLREFSSVGPEVSAALFFNTLHDNLPDDIDLKKSACSTFKARLDAIAEDLTCTE